MGHLSYDSGLLKRYLLGDLPPAQQDLVEEKFFTENDLFIALLDAEDQLIGDYLSGRLSAADRTRFERYFLTLPDRRREVELAQLFGARNTEQPMTEPATPQDLSRSWYRQLLGALRANPVSLGAATAALVLIAGAGVWLLTRQNLEQPYDRGVSNTTTSVRSAVITLELSPGRFRSTGEAPKAVKTARTRAIELKLAAGQTAFSNYRGRLQRLEEEAIEVLKSDALKWEQTTTGDRVITWEISTDRLPIGNYQVKLEGVNADNSIESIGAYHFKMAEE